MTNDVDKTTSSPFDQLVPIVEDYGNNTTNLHSQSAFKFLSDEASLIMRILFLFVFSALISIVGIITNVINIIVFIKQGAYKECGSVNLLGLAVSDFCVVATMLYTTVIYILSFVKLELPWEPFDFVYMTGSLPHLMFTQITRAITAYVSFERCVCVVLPFKVKTLLTPNRSIVIMASISLCVVFTYVPMFAISPLKFRFNPYTNRSRLVRVPSTALDVELTLDILWYLNSVSFNLASVAIVFICTLITVSRVKLSKTWRDSMATGSVSSEKTTTESSQTKSSTPSQNVATKPNTKIEKEKKLIKMIISISVIFLSCYLTDLIFLLMHMVNREISTLGKYRNLALAMYSMTFFMETFNSSINIFVYYRMSSRYKQIFRQLMGMSKEP